MKERHRIKPGGRIRPCDPDSGRGESIGFQDPRLVARPGKEVWNQIRTNGIPSPVAIQAAWAEAVYLPDTPDLETQTATPETTPEVRLPGVNVELVSVS